MTALRVGDRVWVGVPANETPGHIISINPRHGGQIEYVVRTIDLAGRPGTGHLFVVDQKSTEYVDCTDVAMPYGRQLLDDVRNRTQTAMPQAHAFLAAELALRCELQAQRASPRVVAGVGA